MSLKDIEFWMSLYDILKDVWFLILIPIVISIVKLLNKNDLYQTRNVEKIKMVLKNTRLFILITIGALIYLVSMIFFSLSAYPKDEVMEYISKWDNIGSFTILIIMYAMLFPIVTIPFLGERRNKRFFLEKNNNEVIEREIIDRVYINGKDKLILKDGEGIQTEKNVTDIDNLTFKIQDKKSWIAIFIFICSIPTVYLAWNLPSIIDMFTKLQKWTDIFMYISFFTLPLILIIELYYVVYIVYKSLFKKV
ncbi:hypothetical protein [Staphylococcus aureus]|uniref:hypothetical protein n=1 Tax=Staphylococcus aureus TaxID=1280 RepID=UPI00101BF958|nr:hypothetical protein [Staphylococcus aureus]HDH1184265.1 hypothetical protein [Staphylococcus aureus]HDH1186932.1 hypothetical protein [Staphylococcus aureus]